MSIDFIRRKFGKHIKVGCIVFYCGKRGQVVGNAGEFLKIRFNDSKQPLMYCKPDNTNLEFRK